MAKILSSEYQLDLVSVNEDRATRGEIRALDKVFHNIVLFDFGSLSLRMNALGKLLSKVPIQAGGYHFKAIQQWIDEHSGQYDLMYCNHVRTTEYVRNVSCRKAVDFVDAVSMNYRTALTRARGFWKAFYSLEDKRLLPYELEVLRSFNKCFITSPVDRDYLLGYAADPVSLTVIPNGVSSRALEWNRPVEEENRVAFLGKMDYYPNEDAVSYFANRVFPLLRKAHPDLKFIIVGAYPSRKVLLLKGVPGIEVTGSVDDPYEYVARSKVMVAPMRFGAGIQNKVLEGMALSKCVVTTSLGARGIQGEDGKHFVIADTPDGMSDRITELLRDSEKRRVIGESAKALIHERFTWDVVGRKLLNEIGGVMR